MNYNDILKRIRYTFDFSDSKMIELFALAEYEVTRTEVSNWLKKDSHEDYQDINDKQLAIFLNGLINDKRGNREGPQPKPEKRLNNNIIFRKLRIALNLKDDDIIDIFKLVDVDISKHELSAFFRHPDQRQFRPCKDQYLRNFLHGMQMKYRKKQP